MISNFYKPYFQHCGYKTNYFSKGQLKMILDENIGAGECTVYARKNFAVSKKSCNVYTEMPLYSEFQEYTSLEFAQGKINDRNKELYSLPYQTLFSYESSITPYQNVLLNGTDYQGVSLIFLPSFIFDIEKNLDWKKGTVKSLLQQASAVDCPYTTQCIQELMTRSFSPKLYLTYAHSTLLQILIHTYEQNTVSSSLLIDEITEMIHKHWNEPFTLEEISENLYCSKTKICQTFKTSRGISVHTYLQQYRLQYAKRYLLETNWSVSKIAIEVGYRSDSSFIQWFKKQTGMTPLQYRRSNNSYMF